MYSMYERYLRYLTSVEFRTKLRYSTTDGATCEFNPFFLCRKFIALPSSGGSVL